MRVLTFISKFPRLLLKYLPARPFPCYKMRRCASDSANEAVGLSSIAHGWWVIYERLEEAFREAVRKQK